MSDKLVVEIPLDPQYLTEEGIYMAGYIYGRHVRSSKDLPADTPEDFVKGVEDGYGSRMLEWEEDDASRKRKHEEHLIAVAQYWDETHPF